MRAVGTDVYVIGPYAGGEFTAGIDTTADLARLPAGYAGGIWTNEIELVAQALKDRRR
jgi:glycerophosphoryl diester phosphodiesterase